LPLLEQSNGGQIYYDLIEGPADRPVLTFLHEGLGCTAMWKAFPQRLCAVTGHPGLVYDRAGHGESSPTHRDRTIHYLHESALQELPSVLEGTIGTRDHILIGHSDGGSIALIYAAERCPALCGVITEAAHVFVEAETITGIELAVHAYEAGKFAGLARCHGEKTGRLFWTWAHTWLTPWFRSWNIEYALPSIHHPILALQGADDQYGTAAQMTAIVSGNPHRRGLIVEGSGHTPHGDQPEVLLGLMAEFIAEITSLKRAV
jgi:pimeloyl-ACP methyl ester carboxylesterase